VVEIGPGADLGIASILLAKGIYKYYAYDVHNLVEKVQQEFYDSLFMKMQDVEKLDDSMIRRLRDKVLNYSRTGNGSVNYICKNEITFDEIGDAEIDIVFSQAAFEHVQNPGEMIALLSPKCASGALLVAEIDLKAHSRWVRDHDPLNIYLYDDFLYRLMSHKATPNRVRPGEYVAILEKNGWRDIQCIPEKMADEAYLQKMRHRVQNRFNDESLGHLSVMLLARKE